MSILPQLERDLYRAAEQRLPTEETRKATGDDRRGHGRSATSRWNGFRRRLTTATTAVPILLAIAVTVIVAAFALRLSHPGRQPASVTPASSVQATRQQLVRMLGVLRRPQTKADLDPEAELEWQSITLPEQFARQHKRAPSGLENHIARLGYPKLDRALVRVVTIPAWHAKVGIQPATWQPSPSSPHRAEGLDLELWIGTKPTIPPSSDTGTGPEPTSVDAIRAHGLALASNAPGGHLMDGVLLVPDGVARITLRVVRLIQAPVKIDPSWFNGATATVHDNIAAFQLALPRIDSRSTVSGLFGTSAVAQVAWFDASGHVIKHTTTNLDVLIKVIGKKALPGRPRGARLRRLRSEGCRPTVHACK